MAVNYRRTAYRLTGGYIDNNAIAMGSSNTITTTALGNVEVAHGMNSTPYVAFAQLLCPTTTVPTTLFARRVTVASAGIGSTYITFLTASCLWTAVGGSYMMTILGSSVTVNFHWCAMRSNQ